MQGGRKNRPKPRPQQKKPPKGGSKKGTQGAPK
jgi:hypothetical protein